jgi:hypothetical protein
VCLRIFCRYRLFPGFPITAIPPWLVLVFGLGECLLKNNLKMPYDIFSGAFTAEKRKQQHQYLPPPMSELSWFGE